MSRAKRAPACCRHGSRGRVAARQRRRDDVGERSRGKVRRRADHALRSVGLPGALRLRGEGLRSRAVDRPQDGAAHGPLHASRARGGAAGRGGLGHRHRRRCAADRRVGCHGHRRPPVVPGLLRRPSRPRARTAWGRSRSRRSSRTSAPGWLSIELGTQGPLSSQCTACAASNMAIGESLDAIRLGRADAMLCGGTEAPIAEVGIAGFSAMRALSRRNDDPEHASRPFDAERDGFVMGEAGAVLVLEELEHAQCARREDLRRGDRLRRLLGREPHHGARSSRPGASAQDGARTTPASRRPTSTTSTPTRRRRRSATRRRRRC